MSGSTPQMVLPKGSSLEHGPDGVKVHHAGDVLVSGPQGARLARIFSEDGSITLHGPLELGEVHADHGSIFIEGEVVADSVVALGGNIVVQGQLKAEEVAAPAGSISMAGTIEVECISAAADLDVEGKLTATLVKGGMVRLKTDEANLKAVQGQVRAELSGGSYAAEIVTAPEVTIAAGASGRINVLECHNDPGTNDLKGKFRLSEYAEFTGVDPELFLSDRDVLPLAQLGAAAAVIPPEPEEIAPEALELVTDEMPALGEGESAEASLGAEQATTPGPEPEPEPESRRRARQLEVIEFPGTDALLQQVDAADPALGDTTDLTDLGDIAELGEDALEAIEDEDSTTTIIDEDDEDDDTDEGLALSPELSERLVSAVDRLGGAYPGPPPEPVGRVLQLEAVRDYAQLRIELPGLFNQLVGEHVQTRSQPAREVIASMNELHSALQQL